MFDKSRGTLPRRRTWELLQLCRKFKSLSCNDDLISSTDRERQKKRDDNCARLVTMPSPVFVLERTAGPRPSAGRRGHWPD